MDYYGLLFLYYLKGLSGKSVLKLFFNIEAGGTEQLLPENTSAPTTTPILADIQYPDGLRTDQYFTYRETPTTVSNKARIKTIKGNTLVWNQLAELNSGATNNCTKSFDSTTGITTITPTNYSSNFVGLYNLVSPNYLITGHKYLISLEIKPTSNLSVLFGFDNNLVTKSLNANTFQTLSILQTQSSSNVLIYGQLASSGWASGTFQIKNVQCFDLTKMGLDITDPSDFTSLFPLSYYDFNAGSLLSFNGTGLKATGKNLISNYYTNTAINNSGNRYSNNSALTTNEIFVFENRTLVASGTKQGDWFIHKFKNGVYAGYSSISNSVPFTLEADITSIIVQYNNSNEGTVLPVQGMVEFGSTASEYEPYTESTLSLPISTYFPNGMKSAGTAYDELTPRKAITRIGAVDLGTLNWSYDSTNIRFISTDLNGLYNYEGQRLTPFKSAVYTILSNGEAFDSNLDMVLYSGGSLDHAIIVQNHSYTDAVAFKTAMSGVYLYYELATPTETPITTEDANEALSLLMGKSVSSDNANQLINIITKGE